MEKIRRGTLILIILLLSIVNSCDNQNKVLNKYGIADFSDLYQKNEEAFSEVNYNTHKRIKYLVFHCTASRGDLSKEWLLHFFKYERGWSKPGYHRLIHPDGKIDTLVDLNNDPYITYDEIAYGARGYNSESIHVAYTGGVDNEMNPKDTRTKAQIEAIRHLIVYYKCKYPWIKVLGHRDLPNVHKACPSFDVKSYYFKENGMLYENPLFDTREDSIEILID